MATAPFRLNSRRSSIVDGAPEDSGPSNGFRRSRSLSRYSGRFPPPQTEDNEFSTPRGRFVNKVRGSGFPEISLDDLADEFFGARVEEEVEFGSVAERSGRRVVRERLMADTESSRRRGRSVSRRHGGSTLDGGNEASVDRVNARQRRSISAARFRHNKLEFDGTDDRELMSKNHPSSCKNLKKPLLHKHNSEGGSLRRSISQKYFQMHDNCSSHSSSLTDDEEQGARSRGSGNEKTIKEVYSKGKMDRITGDVDGSPLYETMCKEVRNMVEELRTELEKVIGKAEPTSKLSNDCVQSICSSAVNTIAELRRSYSDKLEQAWMIKILKNGNKTC
ncbi:hypothetical protein HPP92_026840 [Vanilla planifolia]|uniref:Uncharacterized protein n=1 Tax=Vanilla planifolia TaxID=51239 RepID=A0A835PE33_VANPL|nr:hypothetical protein HPP92_026840 [Vanilla planifolia]